MAEDPKVPNVSTLGKLEADIGMSPPFSLISLLFVPTISVSVAVTQDIISPPPDVNSKSKALMGSQDSGLP